MLLCHRLASYHTFRSRIIPSEEACTVTPNLRPQQALFEDDHSIVISPTLPLPVCSTIWGPTETESTFKLQVEYSVHADPAGHRHQLSHELHRRRWRDYFGPVGDLQNVQSNIPQASFSERAVISPLELHTCITPLRP